MKKNRQNLLYAAIGSQLTIAREQRKLSVSQLSRITGEQFNTIIGIERGRPFSFHQCLWMKEVLNLNINEVINTLAAETANDSEEKCIDLASFI